MFKKKTYVIVIEDRNYEEVFPLFYKPLIRIKVVGKKALRNKFEELVANGERISRIETEAGALVCMTIIKGRYKEGKLISAWNRANSVQQKKC